MTDSKMRLRRSLAKAIESQKPFSINQVYSSAGLHRSCAYKMFPELHSVIKRESANSGYRLNAVRTHEELIEAVREALRHYISTKKPFSMKMVYDRANICRTVALKYPGMLETIRRLSIESGFKSKIS